jgi:predicted NAD/FAD-binding protein
MSHLKLTQVMTTTHPYLALRLKKEHSCTSTPLYAFMAYYRVNFTRLHTFT